MKRFLIVFLFLAVNQAEATTTTTTTTLVSITVKNVDCSNPTPYEIQFCNLSCQANGCVKLKYCFYGYSAPGTPNPPCDSKTGMGYITQFIKVVCDTGDTRCVP